MHSLPCVLSVAVETSDCVHSIKDNLCPCGQSHGLLFIADSVKHFSAVLFFAKCILLSIISLASFTLYLAIFSASLSSDFSAFNASTVVLMADFAVSKRAKIQQSFSNKFYTTKDTRKLFLIYKQLNVQKNVNVCIHSHRTHCVPK